MTYPDLREALNAIFQAADTVTLQEVRRQFEQACKASTLYQLLHERDNLADTMEEVRKAVQGYYDALDRREHGGIAQHRAFSEIERALGMKWHGS